MNTTGQVVALVVVGLLFSGCEQDRGINPADTPDSLLAATAVLSASGESVGLHLQGCAYSGSNFNSPVRVDGLPRSYDIDAASRDYIPEGQVLLIGVSAAGFESITEPVYGRANLASIQDEAAAAVIAGLPSDSACGFNFRVNPVGIPIWFQVAGTGRLHFEADARNATDLTCTAATRECVRYAPESGEMAVEVESAVGAEPGRFISSASVACESVRSTMVGTDRTSFAVRATGRGTICHFDFPASDNMVNVDVQVNGPTTVSYDVMVSGQMSESGTCGDGVQPTSCLYSVQRGAELRFDADEVPNVVPVWSGACAAEAPGSWTARIASADAGAACGIRLEPTGTADCTAVTAPVVSILQNGLPFPQSEVFVDVQGPEGATFDLSAEAVSVAPATFIWEESVNGSFAELGRGSTLTEQELGCAMGGGYCQLRVTVSDACGQRRAGVYYRRQP